MSLNMSRQLYKTTRNCLGSTVSFGMKLGTLLIYSFDSCLAVSGEGVADKMTLLSSSHTEGFWLLALSEL